MAYIGKVPSAVPITSADLADSIVTSAKIADGTIALADLSATGTASASTFLRGDNAWGEVGGGITQANQFRLTAGTNQGTDADITSNIEEVDDASYSKIGTGVTQSSGVYSFPETGIYLVMFRGHFYVAGGDQALVLTYVTTDNSNYVKVAEAHVMNGAGGALGGFTSFSNNIVDVTNTSNVKVKFSTSSFAGVTELGGDTAFNKTTFTFIRLGDT